MKKIFAIIGLAVLCLPALAQVPIPGYTQRQPDAISYHDSVTGDWTGMQTATTDAERLEFTLATNEVYITETVVGDTLFTSGPETGVLNPQAFIPRNPDGTYQAQFYLFVQNAAPLNLHRRILIHREILNHR